MNNDLQLINKDSYYKIAAAVFIQAIVTLTLMPGIELQILSAFGIVLIDVVCIVLAHIWKLSDSELQVMILILSLCLWVGIYVFGMYVVDIVQKTIDGLFLAP